MRSLIVLIETYWNVNPDWVEKSDCGVESLNRNILECKLLITPPIATVCGVLIETYWNVNLSAELTFINNFES